MITPAAAPRVYLAGGLALVEGEVVVSHADLYGPKSEAVVAYLAVHHMGPVSSIELAEAVWDGTPPATWKTSLKALVSRVRTALRSVPAVAITSGQGWYQLQLPAGAIVDVNFAEQSVHEAESASARGDSPRAAAAAGVAAMIASRPAIPELEGEWVDRLRERMRRVHLRALEVLLSIWRDSGQYEQMVTDATRMLEIDPLRESAYAALMTAHLMTDRIARGLATYEDCRKVLADEVGAGPGPEVEAVHLQLLARS